jgi:hypothetical protein
MVVVLTENVLGNWGSDRRQTVLRRRSALYPGKLPQFALESAGPPENPTIDLVVLVVRREEHETAGHAHGDADLLAVELHYETLIWHENSPMRADER